jgi:serine phosphatase RsbU (regulator of sigma subunit)
MLGYTDGIIEARNVEGKMFTLDRLEKSFKKAAMSFVNPQKIYELIFKDITTFQEGRVFDDDTSAFIFTRDTNRDLIENEQELKKLLEDVSLKKLTGDFNAKNKTRQEIVEQARQQKYDRDVQLRLDRLDRLYKIGEYIKLKQEVILYYRE